MPIPIFGLNLKKTEAYFLGSGKDSPAKNERKMPFSSFLK